MRRIALVLALALSGSAALSGCSSDKSTNAFDAPKPLDKMSKDEWCAYYAQFLTNPQLSPQARATDIQRMRERGCPVPS